MRFAEEVQNNETWIHLVGDPQGINLLQECVTSYALGAMEDADRLRRATIRALVDELYDEQLIRGELFPTFVEIISDSDNLINREGTILKAVQKGHLGLAEFAKERRAHTIDLYGLFLTSEGRSAYLHCPDEERAGEADSGACIKPDIQGCDETPGTKTTAIAQAVGATHSSFQYELVPNVLGGGYNLLTERKHVALGTVSENGEFIPLVTVLNDYHPARQ